jgi:hypothetical protein
MAKINAKKLVAFKMTQTRNQKEAWWECYFDSTQNAFYTFEEPDFVSKIDNFHIEGFNGEETKYTVGIKTPSERILVIAEGNKIVLEGGGKLEVPASIAEQFRKFL